MRCQECRAPVSAGAGVCFSCGTLIDDRAGVQFALSLSEAAPEMKPLISDPRPEVRAVWNKLREEDKL